MPTRLPHLGAPSVEVRCRAPRATAHSPTTCSPGRFLRTPNHLLRRLIAHEGGGTHIEYALIGGFTGVLLMGGLLSLQDGLNSFYNGLASILSSIL